MTTASTFGVLHIDTPATPRGSIFAAQVFTRIAGWAKAPVRKVSRASEAAAVREMAVSVQHTDPGFAADLFAAAARHESLDD
jgi:hypothetical protein